MSSDCGVVTTSSPEEIGILELNALGGVLEDFYAYEPRRFEEKDTYVAAGSDLADFLYITYPGRPSVIGISRAR